MYFVFDECVYTTKSPLLRDVELGVLQINYKCGGRLRNRVERRKVREIFDTINSNFRRDLELANVHA